MATQVRSAVSKSHRTFWLVGLAVLACLVVGGVALQTYGGFFWGPSATPAAPPSRTIRASHADFFTGDLKRLQPHLGMTVGCVHLEYAPPDRFVGLEAQFWQDGKPLRGGPGYFRSPGGPADATISLTPVTGPGGKPQFRFMTALTGPDGYAATGSTRDAPTTEGLQSYIKTLDKPIEILDGPPVPVWAYLLYKRTGGVFPREDLRDGTFDEAARAVEWAVVLRIGWKEPDDSR
jgi:hypothetical protein